MRIIKHITRGDAASAAPAAEPGPSTAAVPDLQASVNPPPALFLDPVQASLVVPEVPSGLPAEADAAMLRQWLYYVQLGCE